MEWNNIKESMPTFGAALLFKRENESDTEAIEGTYEEHTHCMLGTRSGYMGEGFQDGYNQLASDGDLWIYAEYVD